MTKDIFESNKANVSSLLNFIDKYRREQTLSEYNAIQEDIRNGDWQATKTLHGNTIFVDRQKFLNMKRKDLKLEIIHASLLADFGMIVYLLKENHSRQNVKNIDTIINGIRIELKYIHGTRATAGKSYDRGLSKSPHISMYFSKSTRDTEASYFDKIKGTAKESSFSKGILIMYYEKTEKPVVQDMNTIIKNMEHHKDAPGRQDVSALHTHSISQISKKSINKKYNVERE